MLHGKILAIFFVSIYCLIDVWDITMIRKIKNWFKENKPVFFEVLLVGTIEFIPIFTIWLILRTLCLSLEILTNTKLALHILRVFSAACFFFWVKFCHERFCKLREKYLIEESELMKLKEQLERQLAYIYTAKLNAARSINKKNIAHSDDNKQ